MTTQYHLAWGRLPTFVIWGLWAIFHALFCWDAMNPKTEDATGTQSFQLIPLVALNLLILLQILISKRQLKAHPDESFDSPRIERRFALVGGFILGVTPLGLTTLAFVSSHPAFRQAMGASSPEIELQKKLDVKPRIKLTIGVDVSDSVIKGEGRAQLCRLLTSIFQSPGSPDAALPGDFEVELWEIGTSPAPLEIGSSGTTRVTKAGGATPDVLAESACNRLREKTAHADRQSRFTDIAGFLGAVSEQLKSTSTLNVQNFIVVASDFYQDTAVPSNLTPELKKLSTALQDQRQWRSELYFLVLRSNSDSKKGKFILSDLRQHLPDQIHEISIALDEFRSDGSFSRHMQGALTPLAWVPLTQRAFVTYVEGSFPAGTGAGKLETNGAPLVIKDLFKEGLGEGRQPIALRLRDYPDRGRPADSMEFRYKIGSGDSPEARLAYGPDEPEWIQDSVGKGEPLQLTLATRYGHFRQVRSLELLILAPELGFKFGVPLTVISAYPGWYKTAIQCMISLFGLCVIVFVLVEYREMASREARHAGWVRAGVTFTNLANFCHRRGQALASH
jgi:hypothetical protein